MSSTSFAAGLDQSRSALGVSASSIMAGSSNISSSLVQTAQSPISHSASVALQQREIVRIHELWQKAKAELRAKSAELTEMRTTLRDATTSQRAVEESIKDTQTLHEQNLRLTERLRTVEADLEQARSENDRWHAHSEHLTMQLRESEGRLGEATARYRQQGLRLNEIESRAVRMEEEKRSILSRSLVDVRDQDEAVTLRDRKLAAQESRMQIQEEVISQLRMDLDESSRKTLEAEQRALRAERKCRAFEADAETSREHLRDHVQTKRTIEALKFEVDHLKRDNGRMVRLLASTTEYSDFLGMAQDSKNGITFAPKRVRPKSRSSGYGRAGTKTNQMKPKKHQKGAAASKMAKSPTFDKSLLGQEYGAWGDVEVFSKVYADSMDKDRTVKVNTKDPEDEEKNWLPTDTMRLALDFKQRHSPSISMAMMTEFLQQLNEIFRLREKRHVARARKRWQIQVQDLKRKLQQRVPYAEVVQKDKINKLRKDLSAARSQVTVTPGSIGSGGLSTRLSGDGALRAFGAEDQKHLLESTLVNVSELSEQLTMLAKENDQLQRKLRKCDTELDAFKKGTATVGASAVPSTAKQDRDFMEGAAWFGRNAVHITDRLSASVAQILSQLSKLRKAAGNSGGIEEDALEDAIEQLGVVVRQCRDRMRRLFEGTLEGHANNDGEVGVGNTSVGRMNLTAGSLHVESL